MFFPSVIARTLMALMILSGSASTGLCLTGEGRGAGQSPPDAERRIAQQPAPAPERPAPTSRTPTPAVPIDVLRGGGAGATPADPLPPIEMRTVNHGTLSAGWALPVEPGDRIEFRLGRPESEAEVEWLPETQPGIALERIETVNFEIPGGKLSTSADGGFLLTAPLRPGNYPFRITVTRRVELDHRPVGGAVSESFDLMILVKTPYDRSGNGLIGDYPVGIYPNESGRNVSSFVERYRELYAPPKSFIHATPEVESLRVSTHYTLGDFVPVNDRGKSSYLALSPRLLELLEAAIDQLDPKFGRPGSTKPLVVLSAFLSPNQLMQHESKGAALTLFTRYQYGDGAAVIWDADGDGRMDDLNQDGAIDLEDARAFAEMLGEVQRRLGKFGGIGAEAAPQLAFLPDTPYVDVDMRGVASRW